MNKYYTFLALIVTIALVFHFSRNTYATALEIDTITNNITNILNDLKNKFNAVEGIDAISTTNYANTRLEYYYYIPKKILNSPTHSAPLLAVIPGLSGRGELTVTQPYKDFAEKEGFIIVSPSFMEDTKNWDSRTSYQYPEAWSGEAFNRIINSLSSKNVVPEKLYLIGMSAGAQFASRYALIYPDLVAACAFHASGGDAYPERYSKVKFFITVGTKDIDYRKTHAVIFYNAARQLNMYAIYREYNVGHELSLAQMNDSFEFFRQARSSQT